MYFTFEWLHLFTIIKKGLFHRKRTFTQNENSTGLDFFNLYWSRTSIWNSWKHKAGFIFFIWVLFSCHYPSWFCMFVFLKICRSGFSLYSTLPRAKKCNYIKFSIIRPSTLKHDRKLWNCRLVPDETTCLTGLFRCRSALIVLEHTLDNLM